MSEFLPRPLGEVATPNHSFNEVDAAIDSWYVELTTESPVATESSTWGQIKALYR